LALNKAIEQFDETSFNLKPDTNAWSPAQIAQHLVLAGTGFDKVLLGNTKPTEGAADKLVAELKEILLNFELKMTSPPFIKPADQHYEQTALLSQLKAIGESVAAAVPHTDLSATCTDFEIPVYGHLTGIEAIYFLIYHTQRHTHQLNELARRKMA
jgi:hypothetical protein